MAGKLKHKVAVYERVPVIDDMNAKRYDYVFKKFIWCAITPIIGERARVVKTEKTGGMVYSSVTMKFIARINAVTCANDMYFIYKGQRYDVDYAVPYFKDMQYQEIYTQLRVENDSNLPIL